MYTHPQQGAGPEVQELRRQAGRLLRQMREQRGFTQRQLAQAVEVEYYTFISQIESGRGRIPPDRYELWAKALNVEARTFVKALTRFYDPITYRLLFGDEVEANSLG